MTTRELARRARISPASINAVEAGRQVSLDVYSRTMTALGLSIDLLIGDRRRNRGRLDADRVHATMGEFEARQLSQYDYRVAIDHPYQHHQFAGRADMLAWSASARALLHIENRTLFPNIQEVAGSFNAKCQYLAPVVAGQLEIPPFTSQCHAIIALWSAEVLHAIRLRRATFRALCPDPPTALLAWLDGQPPPTGTVRTLMLLDPFAQGRQRPLVGLETALAGVKPRVRGYAEAAARAAAQGYAGPGNTGPGNAGPGHAGPGNAGPGNAGPGHVGPRPARRTLGPGSARPSVRNSQIDRTRSAPGAPPTAWTPSGTRWRWWIRAEFDRLGLISAATTPAGPFGRPSTRGPPGSADASVRSIWDSRKLDRVAPARPRDARWTVS